MVTASDVALMNVLSSLSRGAIYVSFRMAVTEKVKSSQVQQDLLDSVRTQQEQIQWLYNILKS